MQGNQLCYFDNLPGVLGSNIFKSLFQMGFQSDFKPFLEETLFEIPSAYMIKPLQRLLLSF